MLDDEKSRFAGYELRVGRLVALISQMHAAGIVQDAEAKQLLEDAMVLSDLCKIGRKWGAWLRRPPAELEIIVNNAGMEDAG